MRFTRGKRGADLKVSPSWHAQSLNYVLLKKEEVLVDLEEVVEVVLHAVRHDIDDVWIDMTYINPIVERMAKIEVPLVVRLHEIQEDERSSIHWREPSVKL